MAKRDTILGPIGVVRSQSLASAVHHSTQASTAIGKTADQIVGLAGSFAKASVEESAKSDAATYKFERDEAGNLIMPETANGFRLYDKEYNAALVARYASAVETDTQETLNKFAVQHRLDPTGFKEKADAYVESLVGSVNPKARPLVEKTARAYASAQWMHISNQVAQKNWNDEKEGTIQAISNLENELVQLAQAGADGAHPDGSIALTRYNMRLTLAREAGFLNDADIDRRQQTLNLKITTAGLLSNLNRMENDPVAQRKLLTAFAGGPGSEGWKEEWGNFTPQQRVEISGALQTIVSKRMEMVNAERIMQEREDRTQLNLTQHEAFAFHRDNPGKPLPPSLQARLDKFARIDPTASFRTSDYIDTHNRGEAARTSQDTQNELTYNKLYPLAKDLIKPAEQALFNSLGRGDQNQYMTFLLGLAGKEQEGSKSLLEARGNISEALRNAAMGTGAFVESSKIVQKAADTIVAEQNGADFDWRTHPNAAAEAKKYGEIGVIPAKLESYVVGALLNGNTNGPEFLQAANLYNAIRNTPAGARVADKLWSSPGEAYFADMMADLGPKGRLDEKTVAMMRNKLQSRDSTARSALELLGENHTERRKALQGELTGIVSTLVTSVQTNTAPWNVPDIPAELYHDIEKALKAMPDLGDDKSQAIKTAFNWVQKGGWGLSSVAMSSLGGMRAGSLQWSNRAPENEFAVENYSQPQQAAWIAQYVNSQLVAEGHPMQLPNNVAKFELGKNVWMRPSGEVNAQGRMTYHVFPVLNNQIQAPLVREDGQIIRIDLQTAWEGERKSASATRLQELNQMREDYFKPTPTVNPGFVR